MPHIFTFNGTASGVNLYEPLAKPLLQNNVALIKSCLAKNYLLYTQCAHLDLRANEFEYVILKNLCINGIPVAKFYHDDLQLIFEDFEAWFSQTMPVGNFAIAIEREPAFAKTISHHLDYERQDFLPQDSLRTDDKQRVKCSPV